MFNLYEFKSAIRQNKNMLENQSYFTAFMNDLFNDSQKEINLLLMAYRLDICRTLSRVEHVDEILFHRLSTQLVNVFGITKENAEWAIDIWTDAFDKGKEYQIDSLDSINLIPQNDVDIKTRVKNLFFTDEKHMYYNNEVVLENKYGRFGCLYWNFRTGTYGWLNPLDDYSEVQSFVQGYKRFPPKNIQWNDNVVMTDFPCMRIQFKTVRDAQEYKVMMEIFKSGEYEIKQLWDPEDEYFEFEDTYKKMKENVLPLIMGKTISSVSFSATVSNYVYSGDSSNLESFGELTLLLSVKKNNKGLFGQHYLRGEAKKMQDEGKLSVDKESLTGIFEIEEKGEAVSWKEVSETPSTVGVKLSQYYITFEGRDFFLSERIRPGELRAIYNSRDLKIYFGDENEYFCFDFGNNKNMFDTIATYITLLDDYSEYLEHYE